MQVNLQSKGLDFTEALKDYVLKRVTNLEKLLRGIEDRGGVIIVNFEVSKSTNHHKSGEFFHADCLIKIDGKEFYSSADEEDINAAIDSVKDSLYNEISKKKGRAQTLFHRGARSIKKMLKGLSKRNPFTGKY